MAAPLRQTVILSIVLSCSAFGCISAPDATRDGAVACASEADCNEGATCGLLRRCVAGACSDDRTLRACADGRYADASTAVGECLTYLDCNRVVCGALVPCVGLRCDPRATPLNIPCGDAGADAF